MNKLKYIIIYFKFLYLMKLYIINTDITDDQAKHLLKHFTPYNGEVCNIIEITKLDDITFKGYLSKLTICKLKYQLTNKSIKIYIENDKAKIIYYLIQTVQIVPEDIWCEICWNNAWKCLQVSIDQGINVNIQDDDGWTPLHYAHAYNSVDCVKILLDSGAKKDIQDNNGETPLHHGCLFNNAECVKLLILNGAKTDIADNQGNTPLQIALKNNSKDCIKLL